MSDAPTRPAGLLGRALRGVHRLIHPDYPAEQARIDAYARRADKHAKAQHEQVERLHGDMVHLTKALARHATRDDLRAVDQTLERLNKSAGRQYRVTAEALKFAEWQEEHRVVERRLRKRLAHFGRRTEPVIVGPWTGEVGFELLYWIPFVTWALQTAGVAPERIVIVSRGGPEPWYAHLGGRYLDILSFVSADDFRAETELRKKQRGVGAFDRRIVRQVAATLGSKRVLVLHPGLMYPAFMPVWKQQSAFRRIDEFTLPRLMTPPLTPGVAERLPAKYVAARFYFSTCFPDTDSNRALVQSVLTRLADSTDVVLLNTGITVDDHRDFLPLGHPRLHVIQDLMRPERNLDVQTAVIARATSFVGTYGGYSYLAPLCGVSSLAFYSNDQFHAYHLDFAQRLFRRLDAGSLVALDTRDLGLLTLALGTS